MLNSRIKMVAYNYYFFGGVSNSYGFATDNQISYEVKFKPSDYLFEGSLPFAVTAFEFAIEIEENPDNISPPLDPKIPHTVAAIFRDFFTNNDEQVIVYICDSSDARQAVRRRKFNQWVEAFKGNEYLKIDAEIVESAKVTYYNSLILKSSHPKRQAIIDAFISITDEQGK